jgi:DNA polymerase-1
VGRKLLFDLETDGLLKEMTRIHLLSIKDAETRERFVFRDRDEWRGADDYVPDMQSNDNICPAENSVPEGIEMLQNADMIIGHNIVRFDIPAIQKLFPAFTPPAVRDTMTMTRMIYSDIKQTDFELVKQKRLPGVLIGSHSLDAWGWRIGMNKGDYTKQCALRGVKPWERWRPALETYGILDVDVTEVLWRGCQKDMPPEMALKLEHDVHELTGYMEKNGFPFDMEGALRLQKDLESKLEALAAEAKKRYGYWYAPAKKKIVKRRWIDPENPQYKAIADGDPKVYATPNTEWGESHKRAVWADITFPKKDWKHPTLGQVYMDAPYCKIARVPFNPGSRLHIIDRFTTVHNWVPEDFTEKGTPEVNDAVLQKLAARMPEAAILADIFQYKKLLGQLAVGKGSWINSAQTDNLIHCYINTGGTVSNRCSHAGPNIGQVPSVTVKKINGKKTVIKGKEGDYGFECRSLFYTPKPMVQVGVDLSGIEFRCLAEECVPFDKGALIETVLHGDIHEINMKSLAKLPDFVRSLDFGNDLPDDDTSVDQRDIVKRILYGLMYGAGDWKLGFTAAPYLDEAKQKKIGKYIRAQLMAGLPALAKAIEKVKKEAGAGWIRGLDGRKLKARSPHSALNLRLQGNAASIAKKWLQLTEEYLMTELGLDHGWPGGFDSMTGTFSDYDNGGDFVLLAFVHDEIQFAIRPEYAEAAAQLCIKAAADTGKFFGYNCPISAERKIGQNWAETH